MKNNQMFHRLTGHGKEYLTVRLEGPAEFVRTAEAAFRDAMGIHQI